MEKEKKVILEILKYNPDNNLIELLNSKDINWITVLGYLTYHRVAGLAYERINNINVRLLDYPFFFTTYMINQAQKIRTIEQANWIKKISNQLIKHNIKHVFLKGSVLNNTLYSFGSRASNDIDILINKSSILKVTKILNELGFVQGKYDYKNSIIKEFSAEEKNKSVDTIGEIAPFIMISNNPTIKTIDVDVNFSLDWNPNFNEETIDYFLDNRIMINNGNGPIYSLNYYHNFIELCIHLYKDSSLIDIIKKRKVLDLYKFIDIYYYIKEYFEFIDINEMYEEILKFKLEKYIYFALYYITNIFPDSKTDKTNYLMKKLKINDDVLNTIFDQYHPDIKMTTNTTVIDRIFSYDLINQYRGEENE